MKKITCLFSMLLVLFVLSAAVPAEAAVPKPGAAVTKKNVLKLIKTYDKDGYYFLTHGRKNRGMDFMQWFTRGRITADLDTAVHEQCHLNTIHDRSSERIYKGKKKFYTVKYTPVFKTKKTASSVPKACRYSRYNIYVADPMPNLSSNVQGVYGLLNEFCAYSWGMNNTVKLYPYYKKYASDYNDWSPFFISGANNRQAYAEFNFFILHYLNYAKKHYPKHYKKIMANKAFKAAYKYTEKKFRKNIKTWEKDVKAAVKILNDKGYEAYLSGGNLWVDFYGTSLFQEEYDGIMKEVRKSKYQKIYKKLKK